MTTLEILIAARELITQPEKWWNGVVDQRTTENNCMVSSVARAGAQDENECANALGRVRAVTGQYLISKWNDSHTHAEVLAKMDEAIMLERSSLVQ